MTAILTEVQKSDEMVKLAREQIDAFNQGDWELLRGIHTSDARYEEFGTERKVEGPEKIVELFKGWKTAFPDVIGTVTSSVASGNKAAIEVTWKGTHTGPANDCTGDDRSFGQASGDARRCLLHLRRKQDQVESPVLRLADAHEADRRTA